jgi:hypothetical protein
MATRRAPYRESADQLNTMKNAGARIVTVAVLGLGTLALPVSAASAHKTQHHGRNHPVMAHIAMPTGAGPR